MQAGGGAFNILELKKVSGVREIQYFNLTVDGNAILSIFVASEGLNYAVKSVVFCCVMLKLKTDMAEIQLKK